MTTVIWKCSRCGYTVQQAAPPEKCPSCGQTCEFLNVTCYTPDCTTEKVDKRLG
jgi:rubredoxin